MSKYMLTVPELAEIFNRNERTIYNWVRLGKIPHDGTKYDLSAVIEYFEKEFSKGDAVSLKNELSRIKVEKEKIELETMRGKYIKRDDVVAEWAARAAEVKQGLMALSMKVASDFDTKLRTKIQKVVKKYVYELLQSYVRQTEYTPAVADEQEENNEVKQVKGRTKKA